MLMKKMVFAPSDSGKIRILKRAYSRLERDGCGLCDFWIECGNPNNDPISKHDSKFWHKCLRLVKAKIKTKADKYTGLGFFCNYKEI